MEKKNIIDLRKGEFFTLKEIEEPKETIFDNLPIVNEYPIEEPQLGTIKENAWNTGFIGIETREPSPLFQISPEDKNVGAMLPYDNKVTFSTSGANQSLVLSEENRKSKWTNATIEDVKQEPFLSKTCTNNWEDKKFCENTGKCVLCSLK